MTDLGWILTKGERRATCTLHRHPLGIELRYEVDGELQRSDVFRDTLKLLEDMDTRRTQFLARGWTAQSEDL